jgi:hypothetical protein
MILMLNMIEIILYLQSFLLYKSYSGFEKFNNSCFSGLKVRESNDIFFNNWAYD